MNRIVISVLAAVSLSACSQVQLASHLLKKANHGMAQTGSYKVGNPYKIDGRTYYPKEDFELVETGIASWYGPNFHGKPTANGERFDMNEITAAHRTLQIPSIVKVTNLENGRALVVRVNDRGPYSKGRIIDLSKRSAQILGFKDQGTAKVRVEVLKEESMKLAAIAKDGRSTKGYEIALNQKHNNTDKEEENRAPYVASSHPGTYAPPMPAAEPTSLYQTASYVAEPVMPPQPITPTVTAPAQVAQQSAKIVVETVPVVPSNIYVQAGSFSVQENALRLSQQLESVASTVVEEASVGARTFYRVKLGPIENVSSADMILQNLSDMGNHGAMIVVQQ